MESKSVREILEKIYFCGGDELRKKKDIDQALFQLRERMPSVEEIRDLLLKKIWDLDFTILDKEKNKYESSMAILNEATKTAQSIHTLYEDRLK